MFDLEDIGRHDPLHRLARAIRQLSASWSRPTPSLAVRGAIDKRPGSEEANLIVNEMIPLDELKARYTKGVAVRIDEREHGEKALDRLREIVRGYPGNCELQLVLALGRRQQGLLQVRRRARRAERRDAPPH